MNRTGTFRTRLVALVALPLLSGIVLTSCGDDPADPGDFPILFTAVEVEDVSDVKVFANDGGTWVEVPEGSTDLFDDSIFAASAVIDTGDTGYLITSDTGWQVNGQSGATYSYTKDDDRYAFELPLGFGYVYADGDYETFKVHMATVLSVTDDGTSRSVVSTTASYDPDVDVIGQLGEADADTVAYQTFKIQYDAED
jgi:hypothetical protein